MKKIIRCMLSAAVAGIALWVISTSSQVPPLKTVSAQCHWFEEGHLTAHTHFDSQPPIYSNIVGPVRIPFSIKLFQTDGEVFFDLDMQETVTKIEWDDTGSEVAPRMVGDPAPHALKEFKGHYTIDPFRSVGGHGFPLRGWYSPQIQLVTKFATGAETLQLVRIPFYSMLDPNAPDGSLSGAPILIASCYPHSNATDEWGTNYVEADNRLPIFEPIRSLWTVIMGTASYGGRNIGDGVFKLVVDLDYHHDILGRTLKEATEPSFTSADRAPNLDPAVIGSGTHKVAFIWSKPTADAKEAVTALLVIDVDVDVNAPPPSEPPPPPPPPPVPTLVWQSWGLGTWNVSFEREVDTSTGTATGRMRACIGGQCIPIP